ncbi:MAG: hypothetical protein IKF71_04900 [Bacilli bacterium]|nr:hypothetical protein [Bacilli bacterium]
MNDEFQSVKELYQRVLPALRTKVHKLSSRGVFVVEEDIWNLLMEKWKNERGLTLYDIVDDILKIEEEVIIDKYKNNKEEQ